LSDILVTADAVSEVQVAADIMIQNGVRHSLVVEGDDISKPLGIITRTDFTGYLKENFKIDSANAKILESLKADESRPESMNSSLSKTFFKSRSKFYF